MRSPTTTCTVSSGGRRASTAPSRTRSCTPCASGRSARRYAAELLEGKAAARFVEKATEIQDLLGEHQDATVAEERLRAVVKPDDDAGAVLVAGRLVERQRETKQRVREELPRRLKQLVRRGKALGD